MTDNSQDNKLPLDLSLRLQTQANLLTLTTIIAQLISSFSQDLGNENPEVERPLTPIEVINALRGYKDNNGKGWACAIPYMYFLTQSVY